MRADTRERVDAWWCTVFGLPDEDGATLWRDVTVTHPHGLLADYPGWYVAWRDAGVHVSAPSDALAAEVASLRETAGPELQDPAFWEAFARQRGLELRGPSVHHVLDEDPSADPVVVRIGGAELQGLREQVPAPEWDGAPRDIGVLVAPDRRGSGLALRVGRTAGTQLALRPPVSGSSGA